MTLDNKKIEIKLEDQGMWQSFHGKGNSDKVLAEKAKILAAVLIDWANTSTKNLIEQLEKKTDAKSPKEKYAAMSLEAVLLYAHIADRLAFEFLKIEQRNYFMDALMKEMLNFYQNKPAMELYVQFKSDFTKLYNARQAEYGGYKMGAVENEGLAGTLFWEFNKKIAEILGMGKNIIIISIVKICLIDSLEILKLYKLFEE